MGPTDREMSWGGRAPPPHAATRAPHRGRAEAGRGKEGARGELRRRTHVDAELHAARWRRLYVCYNLVPQAARYYSVARTTLVAAAYYGGRGAERERGVYWLHQGTKGAARG